MNKFFYELTMRNWGFPYHVILADAGMVAGLLILLFFNIPTPFLWHVICVGIIVNAIGYWYETTQDDKEEFWEDIIGNNFGIILGSLKVYLIMVLR